MTVDVNAVRAALEPLDRWTRQCHAASLALVRSGALNTHARVARGFHPDVPGQHSWVVLGDDCYDPDATVVDPTLWSYQEADPYIAVGAGADGYRPHGAGTIWTWGRPNYPTGPLVELAAPEGGWSDAAARFLSILGPLDFEGWCQLAHAPVGGWPAGEILGAMWNDDRLGARVPIDVVGMASDLNPNGLYA